MLFCRLSELSVIQFGVSTALLQKLFMRALFYHSARLHNEYGVGVDNRRKAVCDDKRRPALHELFKCVADFAFRTGVDRRRRFV